MNSAKQIMLAEAAQWGNELHIGLRPRTEQPNPIHKLVVALDDVRAADDIRISYDFKRDGWKIEQASVFDWPGSDTVCDPDWKEVAFVKAWARDSRKP